MRHLFATNLLINQSELRWNLWRGSYSAYTFNWKKLLQTNETTQDYHVLVSPHISMRLPLTTLNQHGGKLSVLSDIQTTLLFKRHIKTWLWGQTVFPAFQICHIWSVMWTKHRKWTSMKCRISTIFTSNGTGYNSRRNIWRYSIIL